MAFVIIFNAAAEGITELQMDGDDDLNLQIDCQLAGILTLSIIDFAQRLVTGQVIAVGSTRTVAAGCKLSF